MKRLCLTAGCPHPATHRGRCHIHAKARPYDSRRWRIVRRRQLYNQPLCAECGEMAEHVDHKVPASQGGDPFAPSNLQSLCARCNAQKSQLERQ